MKTLNSFNKLILDEIKKYQELDIYGDKISTPYYINSIGNLFRQLMRDKQVPEEPLLKVHTAYKNREIPFGWYRGKGTAKEIAEAAVEIGEKAKLSLQKSTPEGKIELMRLFGLGVDCSGFLFNIFDAATKSVGTNKDFIESLAWTDPEKQHPNYAGAFVFAGKASSPIEPKDVRALDILYFKSGDHIALVVKVDNELKIAQAALTTSPSGITIKDLKIENNVPNFEFDVTIGPSWNELFKNEKIEFRRLKFLDE